MIIKNKRGDLKKLLPLLLMGVLLIGIVLAVVAYPAATGADTVLNVQTCNTETASATSGNFVGACTASNININDGTTQTATVSGNNQYMGLNMTAFNSSITNCGTVSNVKLCYEWWSSSANIAACRVSVDANNGASFTNASTTCPGTTANPGVICADVTALETWTCGNFLTATGTRAIGALEVESTTGGAKTLTVDTLFFNVTYSADTTPPSVVIVYPTNTTYNTTIVAMNATISDSNLQACWYSLDNGVTNTTFTCGNNVTGINSVNGSNTWRVFANDSFGNLNFSSFVTFSINQPPVISNVTLIPTPIASSTAITIYANTTTHGVNDTEQGTLQFFCSDNSIPTASNTNCTGGTTTDTTYPYALTCSFTSEATTGSYTKYCRVYDGLSYSNAVQANYTVNATVIVTSIVSVAGDATASYFDTVNDGLTEIIVSGESGMACRWSSSDLSYSGMSNACSISTNQANCSVNDVASQGFTTRYVSCQNSLGVGQNASQNLDVSFFLDYTAPTTSDNSVTTIQVPNYTVTITESDNVDSDPTTLYCTDTVGSCVPSLTIDNGGTITFTSSNRGVNYLRYNSTDDAGNSQATQNKTININRLPVFTSAVDNAGTILGGTSVTITTVSSDADSAQNLKLYVCNSSSATFSGCGATQYCTATATENLTCGFASETDSATHTWYAFIFDELNESASTNPLTGSYTTDSTPPVLTIVSPTNTTYTQNNLTFSISSNEPLSWAAYSLNGTANVTMTNSSATDWSADVTGLNNAQYNITFYGNDSYNNLANTSTRYFTIDTTGGDTTPPTITIRSPTNNTYYTSANILLNITTDEALSWAGFTNNSNVLRNLGNVSTINWNATITLAEGEHNITFYANDSSSNKNQANKSVLIYVDLTNPAVPDFSCTTPVNDSKNVTCSGNATDAVGLNHTIVSFNATGAWQNSSIISLSGTSSSFNYTISPGNTTPGIFGVELLVYDLSGRLNNSKSTLVTITDDTFPTIWNITYHPNTTDGLDPDVPVLINATIIEDYSFGDVFLMYKNSSALSWSFINMTNRTARTVNTSVIYNASFTPKNETWYFKINASDAQGNQNISENYTLSVDTETSFWNSTTITNVESITYSQRLDNNSLGLIFVNNTGDTSLNFTLNISSSIRTRFNLNYTGDANATFDTASGKNLSLTLLVNTTSLTSGLYGFNISVSSSAGTSTFEKYLNIQTSNGPYLVVTIDTYSSSVTQSQTGVSYSASVTNLGTQDATGVYLNWTLPSGFSLASGNISRSLGNLPIGVAGTNTITIDVSSGATLGLVNIVANATASNADSTGELKSVNISQSATTTVAEVSTGPSGGGGGGGTGSVVGSGNVDSSVFSQDLELVRDQGSVSFEISVSPKYDGSTLKNLKLTLSGYPEQYVSVSPNFISLVDFGELGTFNVKITPQTYSSYEEKIIKVIINGEMQKSDGTTVSYSDTRNINLVIQEISRNSAEDKLLEAKEAIKFMKENGFNSVQIDSILKNAEDKLEARRNKDSYDLSQQVISIKDQALLANNLIRRIVEANANPRKSSLLVGESIKDFKSKFSSLSLTELISQHGIFSSPEIRETLGLSIAAFERGDFTTSLERARAAQALLLFERKGNLFLFLYLYWYFIIVGAIILSFFSMVFYRGVKKVRVSNKIHELNIEERNINKIILALQQHYFAGRLSSGDYHSALSQNQERLSKIKRERINLRNKRLRLLSKEKVVLELNNETRNLENEIKHIQELFYKQRKMSESDYHLSFNLLQERLAEIENERTTLNLMSKDKRRKI